MAQIDDQLVPLRIYGLLTVQSEPREGMRKFGVPPGGPLDRESHLMANHLAGADPNAAAFELIGSAVFEAQVATTLAVVGAPGTIKVRNQSEPTNGCWRLSAGEQIEVQVGEQGFCVYLSCGEADPGTLPHPPTSLDSRPIRVVPGPQAHLFDFDTFIQGRYTVSAARDRVGLRLDGASFPHDLQSTSEPACPGAIQITNAGAPIILGPDGPTIGGYPKIAVVIDADLDRIGQLPPGGAVQFERVSIAEALWLSSERSQRLAV